MSPIERYTFKRFRRLTMLMKRYSSEEAMETLHGIRVEIKKIKVILRLINEYGEKFHAHRHYVPLRDIFRKAGEIRQPQVFYELLLRYEIQGIADSRIPGAGRQAVLSREFRRHIPVFISVVSTQKNKLKKFLAKIKAAQVKEYLKARKKELGRILQGNLSGIALHKARKVIKEVMYLETVSQKAGKREKYFGQLEELIGQWHDSQLLLEVLKKVKSPELGRLKSERDREMHNIKKSISDHTSKK